MLRRGLKQNFFEALQSASHGSVRVTLPDGESHDFEGRHQGPQAAVVIHDMRAVMAVSRKGDIGLAESYRNGWWDSDDLASLFQFGLQNDQALDRYIYGGFLARLLSRLSYLFVRNTLRTSKKNIHAHYDLGNDFYALWLDPSMTYSSALFSDGATDLVSAQHRKYDRIIERLGASGRLLEIGCGWGGFAERAIARQDFDIKGLTISKSQFDYARKRLGGQADIALEDYRLQQGRYDQIVSIEMFEAVGESFWPLYFSKLQSLLAAKGKAIIQTIVIDEPYFEHYRNSGDPIRSFIFPGGMLPSLQRFEQEAAKAGLRVSDRFSFGQDYALTLKHWIHRFEEKLDQVRSLGFDESFIRMWRFYLAYCRASFMMRRTDVAQLELQHEA